jgi:hypothetical protein
MWCDVRGVLQLHCINGRTNRRLKDGLEAGVLNLAAVVGIEFAGFMNERPPLVCASGK